MSSIPKSWRTTANRIAALALAALATTQCEVQPTEDPGKILAAVVQPLPSAITDLAAIAITDSSVTFQFTEVDDGFGQLAKFDFRFSAPPFTWDGPNGSRVINGTCRSPINGVAVGVSRTCVALGLKPATNYEFQMRAFRGPWGPTMVVGPLTPIIAVRTLAHVASVLVTPATATVPVGQTVQFIAVAKDSGGAVIPGLTIAWSSSDTAIAQVSASGLVTARKIGSATIAAATGGKQGQAQVTATAGDPPPIPDLTAIAITDTSVTFRFTEVDDGYGQLAKFDFRFGPPPFTWDGPNGSRVTNGTCRSPINGVAVGVSRTCVALGLAPSTNYEFQMRAFRGPWGSTMVVGPLTQIVAIRTADRVASVASVQVSPATSTVTIGQTVQLTAVAKDANGTVIQGQTFAWTSGDTSIAQVNSSGLVTTRKVGSATITAATAGRQGQAQVTVMALPVPGTVSNLAAGAATQSSVNLTFTEVTDGTGAPAKYEVRYAMAPINWATASVVSAGTCTSPVSGTGIGVLRTCTVQGLTASTSYQFQLVPFRGTLGMNAVFGAFSNVASATTTAPPPPPGGLLFASSWTTATGQSDNALRDGGKWTQTRNNFADLAVVPAAGLGFPVAMPNVLRHTFPPNLASGSGRAAFVALLNGIPAPAIGQTLYVRFYFRADYPNVATSDMSGASHHIFEGDNQGSLKTLAGFKPGNATNGTYPLRWNMPFNTWPNNNWSPSTAGATTNLTKGVVYRWEMAITRTNASFLSIKMRLYGADDSTLLYPDTNGTETKMVSTSGAQTLRTFGAAHPYSDINWLRSWELGNNGWSGATWSVAAYDYFGGVCFRSDTWCGPYQPGQ